MAGSDNDPVAGAVTCTDGIPLWFREHGTGAGPGSGGRPWLVLCAPGGRNAAYWRPELLARLARRHRVVVFDWVGQGRSGRRDQPTDPPQLVDDLAALLASLDGPPPGARRPPQPIELVGVGLGATVAALVAARAGPGGRVVGLTLVGASPWYVDPTVAGPTEPTVVALVLRRRRSSDADLARSLVREVLTEAGLAQPTAAERVEVSAAVQRWLAHGLLADLDQRGAWLAAPPMPPIGVGTTVRVLHGRRDPVVPIEHGRRLAVQLGVRCLEVDAGHFVNEAMEVAIAEQLGS